MSRARAEREKRKAKAAEDDQRRREIEAALRAGHKAEDLGLTPWELPPAINYIRQHLNEEGLENGGLIIADLMLSNIPLDPWARQLIAGILLHRHLDRSDKKLTRMRVEQSLKRFLMASRGLAAGEAETKVAEAFGTTIDALRKRRQRSAE